MEKRNIYKVSSRNKRYANNTTQWKYILGYKEKEMPK